MSTRLKDPGELVALVVLLVVFVLGYVLGRHDARRAAAPPLPAPAAPSAAGDTRSPETRSAVPFSARRGANPYLPAGSRCETGAVSPVRESNKAADYPAHAAGREQIFD